LRKLASIQKVLSVRPIEGADKIEAVDVLGWTVVCKKGEFSPGQLCVYFEIDSWLDSSNPAFATFEERFTNWGTKRGMRLRTIKLRKQISQGLVLAISDFRELDQCMSLASREGEDVTEVLKIEKWEPAEESHGNNGGINKTAGAGKFPSFLRKTDQERVQNYITELPKYANHTFEVTTKLDGSSMSIFNVKAMSPHFAHVIADIDARKLRKLGRFGKLWYRLKRRLGLLKHPTSIQGVCSRNIELDINDDNHFSKYVRDHALLGKLQTVGLGLSLAVQGELIAPSIQENYEKVDSYEFHVYDIFDIDKQEYMLPQQAREICTFLGLRYVPVLKEVVRLENFGYAEGLTDLRPVVDEILRFAEGPGMNQGVKREGVVFKCNEKDFSFKAISNSYLLAKEKKAA